MKWILKKALESMGAGYLLKTIWGLIHGELEDLVKKTDTDFDDNLLKFADELVEKIAVELGSK